MQHLYTRRLTEGLALLAAAGMLIFAWWRNW
jgi:hypothetical protein